MVGQLVRRTQTGIDRQKSENPTRPTLPAIPAALSGVYVMSTAAAYKDGQFSHMVERPLSDIPNGPLPPMAEVSEYVDQLRDYLRPGNEKVIRLRIEALLSHWRLPDLTEDVHVVVAGDWLRVVGGFPAWAVIEAANHWLDSEDRRPTIAAIKRLCDDAVYEARLRLRVFEKALVES